MELFALGLGFGCLILGILIFVLIAQLDGRPMILKYTPLIGVSLLLIGASEGSFILGLLGLAIEIGGLIIAVKWPAIRQSA